jgi:hypothetical protein
MRIGDTYIDPEPLLVDGLRRDISQAIRLVPDVDASGAPAGARASIPVGPPAPVLVGIIALRAAIRRRPTRGQTRGDRNDRRDTTNGR